MARRRGTARPRDLARGPGRLATAFGIDACLDGPTCVPVKLYGSARPIAPESNSLERAHRPEQGGRPGLAVL